MKIAAEKCRTDWPLFEALQKTRLGTFTFGNFPRLLASKALVSPLWRGIDDRWQTHLMNTARTSFTAHKAPTVSRP